VLLGIDEKSCRTSQNLMGLSFEDADVTADTPTLPCSAQPTYSGSHDDHRDAIRRTLAKNLGEVFLCVRCLGSHGGRQRRRGSK